MDFSTATAPGTALESSAWPAGVHLILGGPKQTKEPQKEHWDLLQISTTLFIILKLSAPGWLQKWRRKKEGKNKKPTKYQDQLLHPTAARKGDKGVDLEESLEESPKKHIFYLKEMGF